MSLISDFSGASDGKHLDPRVVFPEHVRRYCSYRPIVVSKLDRAQWITDPYSVMLNPKRWSPHPDLDWVVRELAYQLGRPSSERLACLRACFPLVDEDSPLAQGREHNHRLRLSGQSADMSALTGSSVSVNPESVSQENLTPDTPDDVHGSTNDDSASDQQSLNEEQDNQGEVDDDEGDSGEYLSSNSTSLQPETFSCQLCSRPDTRKMIECSRSRHGTDRNGRWFHYECVGLQSSSVPQLDDEWFCPDCESGRFSYGQNEYNPSGDNERDSRAFSPSSTSKEEPDNSKEYDFKASTYEREAKNSTRKSKWNKPAVKRSRCITPNRTSESAPEVKDHNSSLSSATLSSTRTYPLASTSYSATKRDIRPWQEAEKERVKDLMREILIECGPNSRTERRWAIVSDRLASRYSIYRTWTSVKNYWNREGRESSKIDERNVKNPARMVTGVQDKQQRKDARQAKRRRAAVSQMKRIQYEEGTKEEEQE
ncbi:MAG: hypothetical protein Q9217_005315 [Psora testacea]